MSGTSLKLFPEHHKNLTLIAESRGYHSQMPCKNPGTKKIQYYQSLYAYTSTERNAKWPEYEIHIVVYAGSSYFPSNHTAVYMLFFQIPC